MSKVAICMTAAAVLEDGKIGTPGLVYEVGAALAADLINRGRAELVESEDADVIEGDGGPDLVDAVREAIEALPPASFGAGDKPKVDALKKALPAHRDQIDVTLRDGVWAGMIAQGFTRPTAI